MTYGHTFLSKTVSIRQKNIIFRSKYRKYVPIEYSAMKKKEGIISFYLERSLERLTGHIRDLIFFVLDFLDIPDFYWSNSRLEK